VGQQVFEPLDTLETSANVADAAATPKPPLKSAGAAEASAGVKTGRTTPGGETTNAANGGETDLAAVLKRNLESLLAAQVVAKRASGAAGWSGPASAATSSIVQVRLKDSGKEVADSSIVKASSKDSGGNMADPSTAQASAVAKVGGSGGNRGSAADADSNGGVVEVKEEMINAPTAVTRLAGKLQKANEATVTAVRPA
jgi:hypothetical protein